MNLRQLIEGRPNQFGEIRMNESTAGILTNMLIVAAFAFIIGTGPVGSKSAAAEVPKL